MTKSLEGNTGLNQRRDGNPLVSVVVAAYNCAPYLGIAIESALGQSVSDLEVVVVDDASTDATHAIALDYARTGRVRVFRNLTNSGPSYSRNLAIHEALGTWVVQLDGDDWMAPDRIARLLQVAAQLSADYVADDLLVVDDASMKPVSSRFMDKGVTWQETRLINAVDLVQHDLGSIKPLMRRQFILDHGLVYPADIRYGEDFLFLLWALFKGARFAIVPEPLYRLRRGNTGSLTTQKASLYKQTEAVTCQLLADPMIGAQPAVVGALRHRLVYLRQLSALSEFTLTLSSGHYAKALGMLGRQPRIAGVLLRRLPFMLAKRKRRLMKRRLHAAYVPPVLQGADGYLDTL